MVQGHFAKALRPCLATWRVRAAPPDLRHGERDAINRDQAASPSAHVNPAIATAFRPGRNQRLQRSSSRCPDLILTLRIHFTSSASRRASALDSPRARGEQREHPPPAAFASSTSSSSASVLTPRVQEAQGAQQCIGCPAGVGQTVFQRLPSQLPRPKTQSRFRNLLR